MKTCEHITEEGQIKVEYSGDNCPLCELLAMCSDLQIKVMRLEVEVKHLRQGMLDEIKEF